MKTFFCRHSSQLDIDATSLNYLWEEGYIAIHYPNPNPKQKLPSEDSQSTNPKDYSGVARRAMNVLTAIAKEGGYVFAVYENQDSYKVGYVEPNTSIDLIEAKWGTKNKLEGRTAILKGLRMKRYLDLNPIDALSLTCAQPRQGTICRWHKVGQRVQNIVLGKQGEKNISDLTPDLQEVLCSEFLRTDLEPSLPVIKTFLTPIGRTMKDVDILGLTEDNTHVLVQVTHGIEPAVKIERLRKYNLKANTRLILFCKTDNPRVADGVEIYSIDEVFRRFTNSEIGAQWIKAVY